MKYYILVVSAALLTGCASRGPANEQAAQDGRAAETIHDPGYPGPGVHLGIGAGRWGGRTGGGIGIGLGF